MLKTIPELGPTTEGSPAETERGGKRNSTGRKRKIFREGTQRTGIRSRSCGGEGAESGAREACNLSGCRTKSGSLCTVAEAITLTMNWEPEQARCAPPTNTPILGSGGDVRSSDDRSHLTPNNKRV